MFISPSVSASSLRDQLISRMVYETKDGWSGAFVDGGLIVDDFLTEVGRQFLEGQIFAYGSDLRKVCRTVSSPYCPDEITVPQPEKQIPVIGDFASEFDRFADELLPLTRLQSAYQLRVYEPRYGGHPRHVDYAPGFSMRKRNDGASFTTSISLSLPISWNDGNAPVFEIYEEERTLKQVIPGSLAIFGPRTLHAHPTCPDLAVNYAWLIVQLFYEGEALEAACTKTNLISLNG